MKTLARMLVGLFACLGVLVAAQGQLCITVSPAKVVGQKAVVPLVLSNGFGEKIESARAVVFLLDAQGQVVGQATRWMVGGDRDKAGLTAGATNAFHFVIAGQQALTTTNLTAKVTVSRLVLAGGKLADPRKDLTIKWSRPSVRLVVVRFGLSRSHRSLPEKPPRFCVRAVPS